MHERFPESRPRTRNKTWRAPARFWEISAEVTMSPTRIQASSQLANVRYEIRGPLARRAAELEKAGHEIIKLNIGNPGAFGFRAPETMRLAMIENLRDADPYCHQKGIFSAREAVVMQQQSRGIMDANADDVFIGNGVSELILFSLRALLNRGDEVVGAQPRLSFVDRRHPSGRRQGRALPVPAREQLAA
jgi:histidinol-phosphate/aromatic aminotransferase/cobyric acid decarboxylase-like protein